MIPKITQCELKQVFKHLIGEVPEIFDYLGKGAYGSAYSLGEGICIKVTECKTEFEIAEKIRINPKESFVKILHTAHISGFMVIVMEELTTPNTIYYKLEDIKDWLKVGGFDIYDLIEFQKDGDWLGFNTKFANELIDIIKDHNSMGIFQCDIRSENLGYDRSGKLKMFDVTDVERMV